jgi:hypothetical protein
VLLTRKIKLGCIKSAVLGHYLFEMDRIQIRMKQQYPDPYQIEKQEPDPFQSEKQDPDPYQRAWILSNNVL